MFQTSKLFEHMKLQMGQNGPWLGRARSAAHGAMCHFSVGEEMEFPGQSLGGLVPAAAVRPFHARSPSHTLLGNKSFGSGNQA